VIQFPKLESWNNLTKVATIVATSDKKRVLCRISFEVLRDKFGASKEEPMKTVVKHRTDIQEVASKLIEDESYEEDGSILIRACNF
jgi:hypothetical protein